MEKNVKEAIKHRRSYYSIGNQSPVSDAEIEDLIRFASKYVPSPFNSQGTRLVLLLGDSHKKLWNIAKEILRKIVPAEAFHNTENKINSFAAGYGTVLYFEDQSIIGSLQEKFPIYKENFPVFAEHTSAMHQFAVWIMLEDIGFGASLQHYNPLIDEEIRSTWNIPETWKLLAQMPFGNPVQEPGEKSFEPVEERIRVFS
ncbi:MAG: nitroreductase family protein [Candidatus Symbiothrix sp.]|jgi:predicted oxidoreductase (fatty acid repression mutant protein)|nr:nitroreductase family protein [Candidatus Symbiothrix sp.]